jgi:hypothetical protein
MVELALAALGRGDDAIAALEARSRSTRHADAHGGLGNLFVARSSARRSRAAGAGCGRGPNFRANLSASLLRRAWPGPSSTWARLALRDTDGAAEPATALGSGPDHAARAS